METAQTTPAALPKPRISDEAKAQLDGLLAASVASGNLPAQVWAAANTDEIIYFSAGGDRVFGEPDKGQVDDETVLELYSMTKLVTSVAVQQLVDRGLVDMDDSAVVEKHAPELVAQPILTGYDAAGKPQLTARKKPLTMRHLLSHTSGLAYGNRDPELTRWVETNKIGSIFTPNAGLETITYPLCFEPGTRWMYGVGVDWAGVIVERISGQSLEDFFVEHIFRPLGITSMTFYPTDRVKRNRQHICVRVPPDGSLVVDSPLRQSLDPATVKLLLGGAGLFGTPRDYLLFLQGVLRCQHVAGIISPRAFRELFTNALPPRDQNPAPYTDLNTMIARTRNWDDDLLGGTGRAVCFTPGLAINEQDSSVGRRANSGCWGGAAKTECWIDPTAGLTVRQHGQRRVRGRTDAQAVCCTQLVAPNPDPHWPATFRGFERALYDALV